MKRKLVRVPSQVSLESQSFVESMYIEKNEIVICGPRRCPELQ